MSNYRPKPSHMDPVRAILFPNNGLPLRVLVGVKKDPQIPPTRIPAGCRRDDFAPPFIVNSSESASDPQKHTMFSTFLVSKRKPFESDDDFQLDDPRCLQMTPDDPQLTPK